MFVFVYVCTSVRGVRVRLWHITCVSVYECIIHCVKISMSAGVYMHVLMRNCVCVMRACVMCAHAVMSHVCQSYLMHACVSYVCRMRVMCV